MHKITNLWKFELIRSSKLRDINERKRHHCHTKLHAFWSLISRPQILNLRSRNQIRGKLLLSRKLRHYVAHSHNVLYHPCLPITRNQERFYDDKDFEKLPIVSTAFKTSTVFKLPNVFNPLQNPCTLKPTKNHFEKFSKRWGVHIPKLFFCSIYFLFYLFPDVFPLKGIYTACKQR